MSTIKDIAKVAGVSTATVSNVMNDSRYVSPLLKERVLTAIADLDYRPNAVARSLRMKKTSTIGLIVPDNSNPFYAEVAKGVEDAGFDCGVSVVLCNSDGNFDRECRYLQLLTEKQVDGLILIATTPEIDHLNKIVDHSLPIVVLYRHPHDMQFDSLTVDNFAGGYLATRHLIELGHRAIACVAPASINSPSSLRVEGYRHALQEAGLEVAEDLIFRGDNRYSGGHDGVRHLLSSGKTFTALFAGNDVMAVGAIREIQRSGLGVPKDISVVGFDGIALGAYVTPSLTTVEQPSYAAGSRACQLLSQRIERAYDGEPRFENLAISLIKRESTSPPRLSSNGGVQLR